MTSVESAGMDSTVAVPADPVKDPIRTRQDQVAAGVIFFLMGWLRRRAESGAKLRQLKQALDTSRPHAATRQWLATQPSDTQLRYSDLRFELGGKSCELVRRRLVDQGWDAPDDNLLDRAKSIAAAPEHYVGADGTADMVVQGQRHHIQRFTRTHGTLGSGGVAR